MKYGEKFVQELQEEIDSLKNKNNQLKVTIKNLKESQDIKVNSIHSLTSEMRDAIEDNLSKIRGDIEELDYQRQNNKIRIVNTEKLGNYVKASVEANHKAQIEWVEWAEWVASILEWMINDVFVRNNLADKEEINRRLQ